MPSREHPTGFASCLIPYDAQPCHPGVLHTQVEVHWVSAPAGRHLRRVKVDPGFHTIGRQAWRYCRSLQIVKLPDTVVAIEYAAFQGRYSLVTVEMPGCVELGVRLFSERCALEKIGTITDGACRLAIGAVVGPYAFEECAQLSLPHVRAALRRQPPRQEFHKDASTRAAFGRLC